MVSNEDIWPFVILPLQNLAAASSTDASVDTSATMPEAYEVNTEVIETPSTFVRTTISSSSAEGETPQLQCVVESDAGLGTTSVAGGAEVSTTTEVSGADTNVEITGSDV